MCGGESVSQAEANQDNVDATLTTIYLSFGFALSDRVPLESGVQQVVEHNDWTILACELANLHRQSSRLAHLCMACDQGQSNF